jgi:hypothetical protein
LPTDLEEEAVAAHGVVDARAGEDQAVGAAEGGDEDGAGHELARRGPKICSMTGGGDAVLGGVLNAARQRWWRHGVAVERQHEQVDEVARM